MPQPLNYSRPTGKSESLRLKRVLIGAGIGILIAVPATIVSIWSMMAGHRNREYFIFIKMIAPEKCNLFSVNSTVSLDLLFFRRVR